MSDQKKEFETIEEYIGQFPGEVQGILRELRRVIKEEAPTAEEKITYQMPTFYLNGNLVHFAAWKKHIGFYAAPSAGERFKAELKGYKTAKGTIQFPFNQPIPYELVREIVRFRVEDNLRKNPTRKA